MQSFAQDVIWTCSVCNILLVHIAQYANGPYDTQQSTFLYKGRGQTKRNWKAYTIHDTSNRELCYYKTNK